MPIEYSPESRTFFLQGKTVSYVIKILPYGHLAHLYWGARLTFQNLDYLIQFRERAFSPNPPSSGREFSLDTLRQEIPVYGSGDFRAPMIEALQANGSRVLDLRYSFHRIKPGKKKLANLPSTYASETEAQSLVIGLRDDLTGLEVEVSYTVFDEHSVIVRSVNLTNQGQQRLQIHRLLSATVDLPPKVSKYDFLTLSGAWARERDLTVNALRPGMQSIESRRGVSSPQHNPFFALTQYGDNERCGEVFAFNLIYSGNFLASVEVDSHDGTRAQIGINPFDFSWCLEPGDAFQAPEAVLVHSSCGLGEMSRTIHRFYQQHLFRPDWVNKTRPILINNWEATYFDFDAEKLLKIVGESAKLGVELFVLDDGWFGKRNDDKSSLGDWIVNEEKLAGNLPDFVGRVQSQGLKFGIWFEPEMVSPDSELYRKHPDWCLHVPDRARSEGRNQLVLDFSRSEVVDHIYDQMRVILEESPITYVKWDMNRHLTEVGSLTLPGERQRETAHRYVLGVYRLMDQLTTNYPDVIFEGCSGGGGRFDPGILAYMPQIWTSDNADPISRLRIQFGTSLVYPWSTMSAHVAVSPNHVVGRITPLKTRAEVAMTGAFGLELDVTSMSPDEKEEAGGLICFYQKVKELFLHGDFYRLRSPFTGNDAAWMIVSPDRKEVLVTHVLILAVPNPAPTFLNLEGLDPQLTYRDTKTQAQYRADVLREIGLPIPYSSGDFQSHQWHLLAE